MKKIKKGNEFIEVHSNDNGTFLVFGAEVPEQKAIKSSSSGSLFNVPYLPPRRKSYEMNLSEKDKEKLIKALSNGKATV